MGNTDVSLAMLQASAGGLRGSSDITAISDSRIRVLLPSKCSKVICRSVMETTSPLTGLVLPIGWILTIFR